MDPVLLEQARGAARELEQAEQHVLLVRADYHAAVRLLHLEGASLRAIAEELELSHQRVQQIVQGSGGSWWRHAWSSRRKKGKASCTGCGRSHREVARLIAGPKGLICDACVGQAEAAAKGRPKSSSRFELATPGSRQTCDFCEGTGGPQYGVLGLRTRKPGRTLVVGPLNICSECLVLCRKILEESES